MTSGSLTLREERGATLFEKRVLSRICGPKRDQVTRQWRKLYDGELNDLYASPYIYFSCDKIENEKGCACSMNGGEARYMQGVGGET
jgi:hypothetical protein